MAGGVKGFVAGVLALLTSVPVLTLVIIIVFDIFLRQGNPIDARGYHTVDLWNLPPRLAICRKTDPDVALLGSSLFLTLNLQEKEAFAFSRLYPKYFQEQLRKATNEDITCINMCTGAQMVSESYMIAQAISNQSDYPRVIFYGLALRDFICYLLSDEWTTDSFASVCPYVPVDYDVMKLMSSDVARGEFLLSHFWYMYRNRLDFKNVFAAATKNMLELLPLDKSFLRVSSERDYAPSRYGWLWEEWIPRNHLASQFDKNPGIMKRFVINEHLAVFRNSAGRHTWDIEAKYMQGLMDLCKRKGIQLVLVNMPLGDEVMSISPPGLQETFQGYLSMVSQQNNVPFINLYGDSEFPTTSFSDGAHLTFDGSKRLANRLVRELKEQYPQVLEAMAKHAEKRERSAELKAKQETPFNSDIKL